MDITISSWKRDDCTLGVITCEGFKAFTLELPWKDNQSNISCIPEGTYVAKKYMSPSKKSVVLMLDDVPGRSYIQIHAGNYTRQIEGCILVGDSIKFLDADDTPDVTNSGAMLRKLLDKVPEKVTIHITRV